MQLETTMTVVREIAVKVRVRMVVMMEGGWGCS